MQPTALILEQLPPPSGGCFHADSYQLSGNYPATPMFSAHAFTIDL
jgi:hypothetical protein